MNLRPLTEAHIAAIEARGLDPELLVRLGVSGSDKLDGDAAIAIPYLEDGKVVGRKHRTLAGNKRFMQDVGSKQIFYNVDCLRDPSLSGAPLLICEGEMDCMAALQAGYLRSVSVPGGAPNEKVQGEGGKKYAFLDEARGLLDGIKEIVLATDDDGPGQNLRSDLALRLGAARCRFITYPKGCKDLNDALRQFGERGVVASIDRARLMAIHGYYEMSELPELAEAKALSTGIVGMDDHYKLRLGDFTVVTGVPSHGKSAFITEVCCRMAQNHGWRSVVASFESTVQTDYRRVLRTFHAEKLEAWMTPQDKAAADAWIADHFGFIIPGLDDEPDLNWMLETSAQAVLRKEAQILCFDPWNQIEHARAPDMTLTEYTGFAVKQIKKFCVKYKVHGIVAVHPAKMQRDKSGKYPVPSLYDIADSAHWANRVDVGIVIHRPDVTKNEALIRIAKVKHDPIGRAGDLTGVWNRERSRYTIAEEEAA